MKNATINWIQNDDGITFTLLNSSSELIPVTKWGLFDINTVHGKGSVASLLSILDDDGVTTDMDSCVLSNSCVAQLDEIEARQLGLPSPLPVRLQIRGQGQLARPGFELDYLFLTSSGRPALGLKRQGSICLFAGKQHLLLDPLYTLVTGIESFKKQKFNTVDDQMVEWGKLKELLPKDAVIDNQLKTVTIVRANQFTLDVEKNGDFSPVLLHHETDSKEEFETSSPAIPEARNVDFSNQFKARPEVRNNYSIGAGWYVVLPEKLHNALQVVRNAQDKSTEEKKAFLANPTAYIREQIIGESYTQEEEQEVEALFKETKEFLSKRIICLGEWEPKLCAYKLPTENKWIPDEEIPYNLIVNDTTIEMSPVKALEILPKVKEALQNGLKEIKIENEKYPVSDEFVDALERLAPKYIDAQSQPDKENKQKPQTPILKDNIEEEDFSAPNKAIRGSAGGLPAVLKTFPLYPHQLEGLQWLQEHWAQGTPGVLLADDMGLGKTLQALTFMAWVAESMSNGAYPRKPFLVVAPTGLLKNWQDEARMHLSLPGLGRMIEGFGAGLKMFQGLSLMQRKEQFLQADWVLTTYETLRDKIGYFLPIEWGVTIFDEAQKIKNPVSRMTEMAKSLETDFTLILTGTPVENELKDLWSIMDTAIPGFLGSLKDFHTTYAEPAMANPGIALKLQDKLLKETTPSMMLRRMKEDHLKGLPEKHIIVQPTPMPNYQAQNYIRIVQEANDNRGKQGAMLKALQHLRNCSLFPVEVHEEGLTDELVGESARTAATIRMLDEIFNKKEKALIFLESLKLQELLIPYLQKRYDMQRPPMRISGKETGLKRKKYVDIFQSDDVGGFDVMILSPKAGGVGLTLTAANHVIHLSRWWNPAVEDQCTDRVFRIGQNKSVFIYYPLAIHPKLNEMSFDQNLHNLLEKKRALGRSVLAPTTMKSDEFKALYEQTIG